MRKTDRQTNAGEKPNPATAVGVGNKADQRDGHTDGQTNAMQCETRPFSGRRTCIVEPMRNRRRYSVVSVMTITRPTYVFP